MNKIIAITLIFFSISSYSAEYKVGAGSVFDFRMKDGTSTDLSIYITESKFSTLSVEYFFDPKNPLFGKAMWQQYQMKITPSLVITAGYIQSSEMSQAEKMTEDFFYVNSGVQVNDFLFKTKAQIDADKIGEEEVEIPAGSIKATHYRKSRNGQVIDFWITDEAKPIGLVKLVSKGKKLQHNYQLNLKNLGENIKAKINPEKSIPLTIKGKNILNTKID